MTSDSAVTPEPVDHPHGQDESVRADLVHDARDEGPVACDWIERSGQRGRARPRLPQHPPPGRRMAAGCRSARRAGSRIG